MKRVCPVKNWIENVFYIRAFLDLGVFSDCHLLVVTGRGVSRLSTARLNCSSLTSSSFFTLFMEFVKRIFIHVRFITTYFLIMFHINFNLLVHLQFTTSNAITTYKTTFFKLFYTYSTMYLNFF